MLVFFLVAWLFPRRFELHDGFKGVAVPGFELGNLALEQVNDFGFALLSRIHGRLQHQSASEEYKAS